MKNQFELNQSVFFDLDETNLIEITNNICAVCISHLVFISQKFSYPQTAMSQRIASHAVSATEALETIPFRLKRADQIQLKSDIEQLKTSPNFAHMLIILPDLLFAPRVTSPAELVDTLALQIIGLQLVLEELSSAEKAADYAEKAAGSIQKILIELEKPQAIHADQWPSLI